MKPADRGVRTGDGQFDEPRQVPPGRSGVAGGDQARFVFVDGNGQR